MKQVQDASLSRALEIMRDIDFPTLPLYLQLIQREILKAEPSFQKIASYISSDIALTAKVLKVVNSPAFATRYVIDDILQALTTLGIEVFYTAVLEEAIRVELKQQNLSAGHFAVIWRHSSQIAAACKTIAIKINQFDEMDLFIDTNHAYLTGLFHDCGIPIMAARFKEYESTIFDAGCVGNSLVSCENRNYHTDHSVVCYLVGKMWELPADVTGAIYQHHDRDFGYYKSETEKVLSLVLRMAESFVEEITATHGEEHSFTADYIPLAELYLLIEEELCISESLMEELYYELEQELVH